MAKKKEAGFEEQLEKLQEIVHELEADEISLENSLKKFEAGMNLAKECQDRLTNAEEQIEVLLSAQDGEVKTKPFAE